MERVSISEAAERLGVSEVTIRRRIKKGELAAEKEETKAGFVYRVLLPPIEEMGSGSQQPHRESAALEAALDTLRQELERRSEENRRLQELLAREQALVQSLVARMPALPEGVPTQETTQRLGSDQPVQNWWSRLRTRLSSG